MSDIVTHLESALEQARQELGAIQRVGRTLTPREDARASELRRAAGLVQEALDVLRSDAGPVDEVSDESFPPPDPRIGRETEEPAADDASLAGEDDTDDY